MVAGIVLAVTLTEQANLGAHVRTVEPRILNLIERGQRESATFRCLVQRLNGSDVIVYVNIKPASSRPLLAGYLRHDVVSAGGIRYLRIWMQSGGTDRRLIPILAHELQHAIEVARHGDVRDGDAVDRLFKQLASDDPCPSCVETREAIAVERRVESELAGAGAAGCGR
jgi:hypothetical protein